jgi:biopolymer transport protein ExbD
MAMNVGQGGGNAEPSVVVDINTTPLIDVMLVLLIMLIITIPIQTHAVKLDMPNGNPPPTNNEPPPVVDISIDFDGTVTWNGQVVPDRQTLEWRLKTEAVEPAIQPEVHVRPNKLATYKFVAAVMASAQRLGVTKIGIVGGEQFAD